MSHEYESEYELERARRQEINNQRVRANTERFCSRYQEVYNNLLKQGLDKFIPDEVAKLRTDLENIENNLQNNPFVARDISVQVQKYVYGLYALGRHSRGKFEAEERQRRKEIEEAERQQRELEAKLRNEKITAMSKEYFSIVHSIKNPAIQNFSSTDLRKIRDDINNGKISDIESLKNELNTAISNASKKAEEWKQKTIKEVVHESVNSQVEDIKNMIRDQKIEDTEKKQKLIRTIEDLANQNKSPEEIQEKVAQIQQTVDEVMISEDVRREAVKAIYKQLKSQNFSVSNPQLIKNGDEDFVRIVATMPSGKRAVCNLTNEGKIVYKFDNYEGMTCLKDIQKFNVDLENIYSVKLSNERVLWSNPDEIGKDADKLPTSNTNKRG